MTHPEYVSTTITPAGRDALRRMSAMMTGLTGQRINMSDALRLAEVLVTAHAEEVREDAITLGLIPEGD